jgi:hypothetical protein
MRFSSHLFVFLGLWSATGVPAADVYRCTGPAGEPLFSHSPCSVAGSTSAIRRGSSGNAAPGLRAAELDWLAGRARDRAQAGQPRAKPSTKPATRKADKNDCARRRMSLDDINARLRRGYKPSQGERLKQRRRVLEDYIATVCRR